MNEKMQLLTDGAVAVKDGKIQEVGSAENILKNYSSDALIEGEGKVVLPGFVNTHTHAAMVYFRGLADDLPLKEWLEKHIWPAEGKWLSPEFVYDAVELACLEMLKAGVTLFNDMYFFGDSAANAAKNMGIRAMMGVGILDFPTASAKTPDEYFSNAEKFVKTYKGDELISPCIAPHAVYTCGTETLKRAKEMAEKYDVPLHIHLSETEWEVNEIISKHGKRPAEYLESIGFLDKRVIAAHCVWLNEDEISLLARRRVGVSHCIESNLKLASGIAPIPKMIKAGVKVSFGTDGAASNNDLAVLGDMATAAKVHKAAAKDPTALNAKTSLLMATRWGAEALGFGDLLGSIEKGKFADVISIDFRKPHLTPVYDVYSHVVYAALPSDIDTVMVNGRILVRGGKLVVSDESEIMAKARKWGESIINA
jgi:5-methylthioadenosine/S-adenosylhomocysteine deaminase